MIIDLTKFRRAIQIV